MNKLVFRYFLLAALALLAVVPALAQDSDTSAFPLTIEHKFGTITLTEAPQRVVSIGYNTQDALFALGVQPVAVRYWFGDQAAHGVFPWAEDAADGAQPALLDMPEGANFEAILALQPDLIVAVYSGITQEEYDLLSQIAPTLAQPDGYGDFTIPWQETTRLIGAALGKSEEAEALIADVEAQFAALREQHPEFAGKTFVIANYYDGSYGYFTGEDPRSRFFTALGFVVPDELVEIAGDDFYANISMERIDLLDQDLLVFQSVEEWAGGREGIESDPVLSQMRAMQEGRAIFIPPALDDAFQFQTVLSLPYFLEGITLELASAVNGGAASTQCEDGFRAFDHALGVSCIPESPERVVVLDTGELDNALALGAPVVGAPVTDALQYQAYLSDQLDGIVDTGSISEPNFEAILALEPDLIIGSKQRYEAIYPQLSAIAPTVFTESLRVPWQDNFHVHADALGRTTEAEPLLADYEAHVAELQAALGDALDSTTISIIRFRPGQVRLYLKSSYIGYILQDVGLQRPPSQDKDVFSAEISIEEMQQVDADYIFVTGYDVEDSERETFLSSPLWQTLDAVQNGHVIEVNDDTWIAGLGVQAASLVLDDLETLLAPAEVAQCEPGFRLFDHEYLAGDPVCIPENPQRILALEMSALESVLLADKELVGTANWLHEEVPVLLPELAPALEGIADTGYPANLEVALLAEPDLILAVDGDIDLEAGRAIAPVVMPLPGIEHNWKLSMAFWSAVLGTQDLYADMLANYEARLAEFQVALTGNPEISIIGTSSYGSYMWLEDTAPGVVVADVGLSRPESQALSGEAAVERYGEQRWIQISEERFDLADADAIFVFTYATTDPATLETENAAMESFKSNPIWNSLSAVQAGHVYYVGPHWWRAQTYLLANKVLDDLFTHLTGVEPTIPNPVEALAEPLGSD